MKLVASVIARNELRRYLRPAVESLLAFCDEIAVVNDGSDDGTSDWLYARELVHSSSTPARFYDNEGAARQWLLDWTLACKPTHILAIDADEFVGDGAALRHAIEANPSNTIWMLDMLEVWGATEDHLKIRMDGGWRPHQTSCLYRADIAPELRIMDKALACGREPTAVRERWKTALPSGVGIYHFGWANPSERQRRYQRYVTHDGGKFHASAHLKSIMWPDSKVAVRYDQWPAGLEPLKKEIVLSANEDRS